MVDIIIVGFVLLAVTLAIRNIIKNKKSGSCCGGCSGCSSAGHCPSNQDMNNKKRT